MGQVGPECVTTGVRCGEAEGPSSHDLGSGLALSVVLASTSYQAGLDKAG